MNLNKMGVGRGIRREGEKDLNGLFFFYSCFLFFFFMHKFFWYERETEREECVKTDVELQSLPTDSLRRKMYIKSSLCGH